MTLPVRPVLAVGQRLNLELLAAELTAANVAFLHLGRFDTDLGTVVHTYDDAGGIAALPAGGDAPDNYAAQLAAAVTNLRAYLGLASPTPAQTVGVVKLVIRIVLVLARRAIR